MSETSALYNIPQFSNEVSMEVVKRLALDCPRIIGTEDCWRNAGFPRRRRPAFNRRACRVGPGKESMFVTKLL